MSDWQLYEGDCLDVMEKIPDGSIDAIITDPPYGIGYSSSWKTSSDGGPRKNRSSFGEDVFDARWLPQAFRIAKADSCLFMFSRWDVIQDWKDAIEAAGFVVVQRLIWNKAHWKMGDLRYYGSQTEDILFCRKGAPLMHYGERKGNLMRYSASWLPEGQFDHPTQKPEYVLQAYISDSTGEGALILDPFMGSGSTGVACANTNRRFIGVEKDGRYFTIAQKRIKAAFSRERQMAFEATA